MLDSGLPRAEKKHRYQHQHIPPIPLNRTDSNASLVDYVNESFYDGHRRLSKIEKKQQEELDKMLNVVE